MNTRQVQSDLLQEPRHGSENKNGPGEGTKIVACKRPADPRDSWTTHVLNDSLHVTHNFDPRPWDDDPAQELLIAAKEGVFGLKRMGEKFGSTQCSGTESGGAGEVRLGRLGGGGQVY